MFIYIYIYICIYVYIYIGAPFSRVAAKALSILASIGMMRSYDKDGFFAASKKVLYVYIYIHTYTHTHTHMYTCIHTCILGYVCVCIYTHMMKSYDQDGFFAASKKVLICI